MIVPLTMRTRAIAKILDGIGRQRFNRLRRCNLYDNLVGQTRWAGSQYQQQHE